MSWFFVLTLFYLCCLSFSDKRIQTKADLRNTILRHYDKNIQPASYDQFDYYVSLFNIVDLDDRTSTLSTSMALSITWKDERLRWADDPQIKINHIHLNSSSIWKPQKALFNRAKRTVEGCEIIHLSADGTPFWAVASTVNTVCETNLRYFPFDKQKCDLVLGTWLPDGEAVDAPRVYVYDDYSSTGTTWSYMGSNSANATYTVTKDLTYDIVRVTFSLQRSMPLLALGIACPALLCGLIGLLPFWMEPNSAVRMALGCTSLVVLTNLFQKIVHVIPDTGNVTPVIVIYCVTCYWSAFLSTLQTVIAARWDRPSPVSSSAIIGFVRSLPKPALRILGLAARAHSSWSDEDRLVADDEDPKEESQDEMIWCSHLVAMTDLCGFAVHFTVFLLLTISVCITE